MGEKKEKMVSGNCETCEFYDYDEEYEGEYEEGEYEEGEYEEEYEETDGSEEEIEEALVGGLLKIAGERCGKEY